MPDTSGATNWEFPLTPLKYMDRFLWLTKKRCIVHYDTPSFFEVPSRVELLYTVLQTVT